MRVAWRATATRRAGSDNQRHPLFVLPLKDPPMAELTQLAHLIAAIVWMGGMTFMLFALRPVAIAHMEPPQKTAATPRP